MTENSKLRQDLNIATEMPTYDPSAYSAEIERLREIHGHAIRLVRPYPDIERFNCYAYAFGLSQNDRYQRLVDKHRSSVLLNTPMVSELVNGRSEISSETAKVGDIVLYFIGGKPTHGAQLVERVNERLRLRSKWGTIDLHEHDLWEVPASYGYDIKYFAAPDQNTIIIKIQSSLA